MFVYVVLVIVLAASGNSSGDRNRNATTSGASQESEMESLLLVSTLDGTLHAIGQSNGLVKWQLEDEPILSVPMDTSVIKGPTFLPNPRDGSLYAFKPDSEGFKKFQFTIPELVQVSPCRSSDGVLYTGRKEDMWISVNPVTGAKEKIISTADFSGSCPGGSSSNLFIGRSEYKITMYDSKNDKLRWNATFKDYSTHAKNDFMLDHKYLHFASSSDGYMVTIDKTSGKVIWANNYGYPVIGMYMFEKGGGMLKVPLMNMAKETLTYMLQNQNGDISLWGNMLQWGAKYSGGETETYLMPSLYVGQYLNNLYAIPAMKHDGVGSGLAILLLPGPSGNDIPSSDSTALQIETAVPAWKLVGYHDLPVLAEADIAVPDVKKDVKIPLLTADVKLDGFVVKDTNEPGVPRVPVFPPQHPSHRYSERTKMKYKRLQENRANRLRRPPPSSPRREIPNEYSSWDGTTVIKILVTISALFLLILILWKTGCGLNQSHIVSSDSFITVGQIEFHQSDFLGKGSGGTTVYKGKFDGRSVAVKRIVREYFTYADREVTFLRKSDEHTHIIRYFCTEKDSQFRYIALELCSGTLQEYIENRQFQCSDNLSQTTIMRQAMEGINHLHSLGIVHRDVKPSNILLSFPNEKGQQKIVLSDFGLCKQLVGGRGSCSQRSGATGTDGWMAPEIMLPECRTTRAVDIFSMGCVYYYILSGKHPFGGTLTRQARIVAGKFSLKELTTHEYIEAIDLIQCMLYADPCLRPTAKTVLKHPLFWNSKEKLEFFQNVSDRIEKESQDSPLMLKLEDIDVKGKVFGIDWRQKLCLPLQRDLKKFRNYKGDSTRDLLRAMRNKKHHYRELADDVKDSLGPIPDQFLNYFTSRFPSLLIHTYHSLWLCKEENIFHRYYDGSAGNHLFDRELPYLSNPQHHQTPDVHSQDVWGSPTFRRKNSRFRKQMADMDMDWRSNLRQTGAIPEGNSFPMTQFSNTKQSYERSRYKMQKSSPNTSSYGTGHVKEGNDQVINPASPVTVTSSVPYATMVRKSMDSIKISRSPRKVVVANNLGILNTNIDDSETISQSSSQISGISENTWNVPDELNVVQEKTFCTTELVPGNQEIQATSSISHEDIEQECIKLNCSSSHQSAEIENSFGCLENNKDNSDNVNDSVVESVGAKKDIDEVTNKKKTAKKKKIRRQKKKKLDNSANLLETQ